MSLPPVLHQETRVSSSSPSPSRILHIHPDSKASAAAGIVAGRKRAFDQISGLDEATYARQFLATEGSVFFRNKQRSPRNLLWRVLDERKILEIQSVDVVHDPRDEKGGSSGSLVFRIYVPAGIVSNGIAFADPEGSDALEMFLLSAANELYTVTLKRDLLARDTIPNSFDATSCLQRHSSSSLAFRHPYKLVAASSLELLVSVHDGGIVQLTRQPGDNGSRWQETTYSEGKWGDTIRGLISLKRHPTARYGDWELEPSALAALAKSPDGKYIWTVTLDHQLKAWSTASWKPIQHMDLLNDRTNEDSQPSQKYIMNANQGTLLQIVVPPATTKKSAKGGHDSAYLLIVRSPKDNQFKFYEVATSQAEDTEEHIQLRDVQPSATLIPPLDEIMDTAAWHLEDFAILPGPRWQDSQLWVRARNGKLCRTSTLTFSLFDKDSAPSDMEDSWKTGWTTVDSGMQTVESLDAYTQFPREYDDETCQNSTTPSERWMRFLFYPGRFSSTAIETALEVYSKSRRLSSNSTSKKSLAAEPSTQERLNRAISSKLLLKRLPDGQPDYAQYRDSVQAEWSSFYSVLRDLHSHRNESIGLAFDLEHGLAWSICADFAAPIRICSPFDRLAINAHLLEDESQLSLADSDKLQQVFPSEDAITCCQILVASRAFSSRLSADFLEAFSDDVISSSLEHVSDDPNTGEQHILDLYERHHFSAQVMDDDFETLETAAQGFGGLGDLSEAAIRDVLEAMQNDVDESGARVNKILDEYGKGFVVAAAQETFERKRSALLSLLLLVVFMYGDLDRADLNPDFVSNIGQIYDALVMPLKRVEMLSWLAQNMLVEPQAVRQGSQAPSSAVEFEPRTLLEMIAIADWTPRSETKESLPAKLTKWAKQWADGLDRSDAWDGVTGHVMGVLIKEQAIELAADFRKFLPQTLECSSWVRYLEGRLLIANGQYDQASIKFQAAAEGMAQASEISVADTARLLSPEERNYFGEGQSRFYQHVSALFEKLKVFSYTADFANVALDHLESGDEAGASSLVEIDRRKAMVDSPAHQRAGHALDEIDILKTYEKRKEEIRIRLFTALVETGRFEEALNALAGSSERPIRNANLSTLIKACIERDDVAALLRLPFDAADLKEEADTALLGLAKKGLGSRSTSIPYHQILYAFRSQHSNFRGAAEILYEHVQRLKFVQSKNGYLDPEEETLIDAYVLLINTLACCGEENAWLLADPLTEIDGLASKRKLVTIADVRRQYAAELDKRSDILQGRFPIVAGAEPMDVL